MLLKGKIPWEEGFLRGQYIGKGGLEVLGFTLKFTQMASFKIC